MWRFLAGFGAGLNLLDALSTVIVLRMGCATEANPIMNWMYSQGVTAFMLSKILVSLLFLFLSYKEKHPLAKVGVGLGFVLYAGVCIHHALFWLS